MPLCVCGMWHIRQSTCDLHKNETDTAMETSKQLQFQSSQYLLSLGSLLPSISAPIMVESSESHRFTSNSALKSSYCSASCSSSCSCASSSSFLLTSSSSSSSSSSDS